ncbi:hypothetical protein I317_04313 [Kwoniella heveanensis CBS 569]|nr:hypothetical protein I317_04313 [Kwoniella heveanensis CBS 569]
MESTLPPLLQATSGALGSAVGNAIVYPLDLATTRMQNNARRPHYQRLNLRDTLTHLLVRKSPLELFSGIEADTLSTLLSNFLYFYTYTNLQRGLHIYHSRHPTVISNGQGIGNGAGGIPASPAGIGGLSSKASKVLPKTSTKPHGWEELIVGMIAGIVSKGIVLPISTVCVRQQIEDDDEDDEEEQSVNGSLSSKKRRMSLLETLQTINRESGIQGLFSGLGPTIPLTLLPSLTLYIHSVLVRTLLPARHRVHPPAAITFILAALSNALATIPLYPLVLIKVLNQSGKDKGKGRQGQELGMLGMLVKIIKRGGIRTLYTGLEGQLVKGLVQQGVMMLVKQR